MLKEFDEQYRKEGFNLIVGCDEAGRGCLLGPVFAGAVILPSDFDSPLINDSKKLTEKKREQAYEEIIANAIAYGIGRVEPEEIDKINILNASRLAMERAIDNMKHDFDIALTDYMKIPDLPKPVIPIAHGDAKSLSIAAASILAKVSRDRWCIEIDSTYPLYNIKKNKGYGTKDHLDALDLYGPVKGLHRFTYAPVANRLIKKVTLF